MCVCECVCVSICMGIARAVGVCVCVCVCVYACAYVLLCLYGNNESCGAIKKRKWGEGAALTSLPVLLHLFRALAAALGGALPVATARAQVHLVHLLERLVQVVLQ